MPTKLLSLVDRAILPLRFLFGALFIYTSVYHALHGAKFLQSVNDYEIVPASLIPWSGFLFIAFEAAVGIALVFGYFVRKAAIAAAALLFVFTAAMVSALVRGLDIACGCGLGDTQVSWLDVIRDSLLIAVALLIAWRTSKESAPAERAVGQFSTVK